MVFGQNNNGKRIVISGTYGTGKTTATRELSRLTGIPPAVARGMREILPEAFPGKKLEDCLPSELVQLGMIRFGERRVQEARLSDGFISDGSAVHEYAYGYGRQLEGASGRGSEIFGEGYKFAINAFGEVVKKHAKQAYTHIVHLPVEFPLASDGHRPVSEAFRQKADEILRNTWKELGFNYHVVGGTIEERIKKIVDILGLDISSTLERPKEMDKGRLWYERAADALGTSSERYFSNGFRNTQHEIYDIEVDPVSGAITAKVDLRHRGDWACKNGKKCAPHFTSIDSIVISGQLIQILMYSQDGITRDESNNLWLRNLELKPGCKPIEKVTQIPVYIKIVKSCKPRLNGDYLHAATIEGDIGNGAFGLNAKVGYKLPDRLQVSASLTK